MIEISQYKDIWVERENSLTIKIDSEYTLRRIIDLIKDEVKPGRTIIILISEEYSDLNGIQEIKSLDSCTEKNPIIYLLENNIDISGIYYRPDNDDSLVAAHGTIGIYDIEIMKQYLSINSLNNDTDIVFYVKTWEELDEILPELEKSSINKEKVTIILNDEENNNMEEYFNKYSKKIISLMSKYRFSLFTEYGEITSNDCRGDANFIGQCIKNGIIGKMKIDFRTLNEESITNLLNTLNGCKTPIEFEEMYDFYNYSAQEMTLFLKELKNIIELTKQRNEKKTRILEKMKKDNLEGLSENGLKNLIMISSVHNYFSSNFVYDYFACAFADLECVRMYPDDEKSISRLKKSKKNLDSEQLNRLEDENCIDANRKQLDDASSERCILNKKSICCGTAKAMVLILQSLGINAKYVVSKKDELDVSHAYVIVEVEEGKWIEVDPTWDFGNKEWKNFSFRDQYSIIPVIPTEENNYKHFKSDENVYHLPEVGYGNYMENIEVFRLYYSTVNMLQEINSTDNRENRENDLE